MTAQPAPCYHAVMGGWTLSTIDEPEDLSSLERIDAELERLAAGADGAPCVLPLLPGDPSWLVRVGNERESVLCDEKFLLEGLAALPTGSPLDAMWRVLRAEARDPTARRH
jgi:hypothetical protein